MKIKIPLLLPALFTLSIYSQQIPLDFSTNDDTFDYFDGSGFSFRPDVQDGANQVGQFFNDGSNPYQGIFINLAQPVVLDTDNKVFSLRFYSFDPNDHTILLKLEDSNNTDVQVQASFSVPSEPSDWIDVFFDFSNAQDSSDGSSVNAQTILTAQMDQLTLINGFIKLKYRMAGIGTMESNNIILTELKIHLLKTETLILKLFLRVE